MLAGNFEQLVCLRGIVSVWFVCLRLLVCLECGERGRPAYSGLAVMFMIVCVLFREFVLFWSCLCVYEEMFGMCLALFVSVSLRCVTRLLFLALETTSVKIRD